MYISAGFIQLVALPLIMVGGNVLNKATEERDIRDSETIAKEFEILKQAQEISRQDNELEKQELAEIKEMHKELKELLLILHKEKE